LDAKAILHANQICRQKRRAFLTIKKLPRFDSGLAFRAFKDLHKVVKCSTGNQINYYSFQSGGADMTRERIIDSACRQILKYGVKRFTIQDIASDLGISKKTFYGYFASKDEVIAAVSEMVMNMDKEAHLKAVNAPVGFCEKLDLLIDTHSHRQMPLAFLSDLKRFYPDIWDHNISPAFRSQIYTELINQGIREGIIRSDINPIILEVIIDNAIEVLTDSRFMAEHDLSLQQGLEVLKSVLLYGVLADRTCRYRGEEK